MVLTDVPYFPIIKIIFIFDIVTLQNKYQTKTWFFAPIFALQLSLL